MFCPTFSNTCRRVCPRARGHELALAGLHERDGFVTFVHRPKAAGNNTIASGVTDEDEFA